MKRLIPLLGLLVLLLALPANAQVTINGTDWDYSTTPLVATCSKLPQDETINFDFRTYNRFMVSNGFVGVKFMPYPPNANPVANAAVNYECIDSERIQYTFNISNVSTWISDGFALYSQKLYTTSTPPYFRTTTNEKEMFLAGAWCNYTAINQDLFVCAYSFIDSDQIFALFDCPDCGQFSIPNDAMAAIVQRTSSTVSAVFDAIDISIMVFVFILVVFILVAIYKLFKYFAKPKQI